MYLVMEIFKILILFGVGTIAGFINVMAGGGSSLTMPALILLMGLDSATANGTNRIALVSQNLFAVLSFRKRKFHQYRRSLQLSIMTLPGAIIGAWIAAVKVSDVWFQRILSLVLIGVVCSMFFSPTKKHERDTTAEGRDTWVIYPVMFAIGFYGGFIQVGVGFIFMASLYHILKLDLVYVNMHKVFIVLIYTVAALGVFLLTGKVNWIFGLCLAAGNSFGAWWGAHFAVKGGEKVIRYILAVAILIISAKLLRIF
jgi:uncharacterized membrane protein YfcA